MLSEKKLPLWFPLGKVSCKGDTFAIRKAEETPNQSNNQTKVTFSQGLAKRQKWAAQTVFLCAHDKKPAVGGTCAGKADKGK